MDEENTTDEEGGTNVLDPPRSVATLMEILRSTDELLDWIVNESQLIRNDFQSLFKTLREDKHRRIVAAIRQLETVNSEKHTLYLALEFHGLTGTSLELKTAIGRDLTRRVVESAVENEEELGSAPRIFGFSLKPLLKWVNLILGSLAKVLPILDAVKEYKESVELTIEHKQSAPVWNNRRIFNLD